MRRFAIASLMLLAAATTAYGEAKSIIFTIGMPVSVSSAFVCKNREAAVTIANLIRDQGANALENGITVNYMHNGICGLMNSARVLPMGVLYNVPAPDGRLLKVMIVATSWPPTPESNLFLLASNTVIGSGIKEVASEGSI
jgi:hypothetical protein